MIASTLRTRFIKTFEWCCEMFNWIKNLNLKRDKAAPDVPLPPAYTPPPARTLTQAQERYGVIQDGKWSNERKHMVLVPVPTQIQPHLINSATGQPTRNIYINADIAPALVKAFDLIIARGLQASLKSFDGCLNIRPIRGSTTLSTHAYGLAIDINAKGNGLGEKPTIDPALVKCFTDAGWSWGGTFHRLDGMHFQIAAW